MAHDVILPKWGMTMDEGTILEWTKEVGDSVAEGESLAVIETEKIETDLPAPVGGILSDILYEAGVTLPVGTVIARLEA